MTLTKIKDDFPIGLILPMRLVVRHNEQANNAIWRGRRACRGRLRCRRVAIGGRVHGPI
ncbi:hypothetical protein MPL1032_80059 [Mesorhizobium plurifarium]|uniref:Uncharacterized protein n=1 Tax=Mesorhizobium plurifarium TaxID=69974 RepID=A0A0K2W7A0_MESPL|nr:hypothetical protein MPL1032_80059 [Mesorhizobium plurifarium]